MTAPLTAPSRRIPMTDERMRGECPGCGGPIYRKAKHDGEYCPECDVWLVGTCSDPECEYCVGRPEKPSEV